MVSRSAISKLKAFLIIDLIIVCATVGAYVYLQNEGVIPRSSKPAVFVFSDLKISPLETYAGQQIQISVTVTNTGGVEGSTTVELEVNGEVKDAIEITLAGLKTSEVVEFVFFEMKVGEYTIQIGDLKTTLKLSEAPPGLNTIVLSSLRVTPNEVWPNEPTIISVNATNTSAETASTAIVCTVDNVVVETKHVEVAAGATVKVEFSASAAAEGRHPIRVNALSSSFTVVPDGYHTIIIDRTGGGSVALPFTLNGEKLSTRYSALLPVGQYKISAPEIFDVGTGVVGFSYWSGNIKEATTTFTLDKYTILVANYYLISGYASCPSLYIWNGDDYSYVTDVSNSGWLGYTGGITPNGEIIFSGGNPYDYVKLDKNIFTVKDDNYFDIVLTQQWDELFYLDSASLLVVDHPIGTDVYTSMTNYLNKGSTGQIYTTTTTDTLLSPISAINEQGQDVLNTILHQDGIFTPGINGLASPAWDNIIQNQLTLDLGDLSNAETIKLVVTGSVDWGPAETYYEWITKFQNAAAEGLIDDFTHIIPSPKMEILTTDGTWAEAPQDKQIPLPSDYTARTFIVDLTGLFPKNTTQYVIRFTNMWNVTYDYIGIDLTVQQDVAITSLKPTSANFYQFWQTTSTATGAFTRYGDVTALLQETDDMFVIGRQGDQVNLQFNSKELPELAENMERDYFFVVACWFKDPPDAWGYGFTYTVEPLPFLNMTGFPYTNAENYPYDETHITYIKEYNTRILP
jgi:hypothetical protein